MLTVEEIDEYVPNLTKMGKRLLTKLIETCCK